MKRFMKRGRRNIFLAGIFTFVWNVYSQESNVVQMPVKVSVPAVSLVSFAESGSNMLTNPGEGAIQRIMPNSMDTTWINYSSVIEDNAKNSICVNIISGNLPAEAVVKLKIGEDAGLGAGEIGSSVGQIALTEYPQVIITDIGTCYTGQGPGKGHPLTYTWEWISDGEDANLLLTNDTEIYVIYTLTASK